MSKRAEEAAMEAYPKEIRDKNGIVIDIGHPQWIRNYYIKGYEQAERDLGWHSVKEMLPPIDEEVIVLTDNIHGKIVPDSHMICYAHRPNPKGFDGKNIETGEVKHYDVVTYDGWNIPGVMHWMHCPKLEEE